MVIWPEYRIHENTVGFYEEYYEDGKKGTWVFDGERKLFVGLSPNKIIDSTLVGLGFCLSGAIIGSKKLFGKGCKMLPLTINAALDIFLLPTKAYGRHDCLWLSLMHIVKTEPLIGDRTRVTMSNGYVFDLEIKHCLFIRKMDKARRLRDSVTRNAQQQLTFFVEPKPRLTIVEEEGEYRLGEAGDGSCGSNLEE